MNPLHCVFYSLFSISSDKLIKQVPLMTVYVAGQDYERIRGENESGGNRKEVQGGG